MALRAGRGQARAHAAGAGGRGARRAGGAARGRRRHRARAGARAHDDAYFELFGGKRFETKITGARAAQAPRRVPDPRPAGRADRHGGARHRRHRVRPGPAAARHAARAGAAPAEPRARGSWSWTTPKCVACPGSRRSCATAASSRSSAAKAGQAVAALEQLRRRARAGRRSRGCPSRRSLFAEMRAAEPKSFRSRTAPRSRRRCLPIETPPGAARTLRASYTRPYQHARLDRAVGGARARGRRPAHGLDPHAGRVGAARRARAGAGHRRRARAPDPRRGPGCYGHNGADDVALDAALLARALPGRPVHVQWTRADEHAWEPYGPAMVVDLQASLDANGRVIDWNHDVRASRTCRARSRYGPRTSGLIAAWHRAEPMARPDAAAGADAPRRDPPQRRSARTRSRAGAW